MPPAKAGEARKTAIRGNDLASRLDGKRCQISVWYNIAHSVHVPAQLVEDAPVTFARFDDETVGMLSKLFHNIERFSWLNRRFKDAGVGDNPDKAAQYDVAKPECGVAVKDIPEPGAICLVV